MSMLLRTFPFGKPQNIDVSDLQLIVGQLDKFGAVWEGVQYILRVVESFSVLHIAQKNIDLLTFSNSRR